MTTDMEASGKWLGIDCTGLLHWFVMSLDWMLLLTINRTLRLFFWSDSLLCLPECRAKWCHNGAALLRVT